MTAPVPPSADRIEKAARAYTEGRWCGECEYGEVADPPCCLTYAADTAPPSADRIEKAAWAKEAGLIAVREMAFDWYCPSDERRPRVNCRECIAEVALDAALAADTAPHFVQRPCLCGSPESDSVHHRPQTSDEEHAYEPAPTEAEFYGMPEGSIQWTGTEESYAAIEALGLPDLRRGPNDSVWWNNYRQVVHLGDWLVPEPVTTWRVSTGPSVEESGAGTT